MEHTRDRLISRDIVYQNKIGRNSCDFSSVEYSEVCFEIYPEVMVVTQVLLILIVGPVKSPPPLEQVRS